MNEKLLMNEGGDGELGDKFLICFEFEGILSCEQQIGAKCSSSSGLLINLALLICR